MTTSTNPFKVGDKVHVYSSTTVYEVIKIAGDLITVHSYGFKLHVHFTNLTPAKPKPKYIWMESILTGETTVHKGVKFIASFENKEDAKQYCHMMNNN